MIEKKKLLLATTNEGKVREMSSFLKDLPYEIISLADLDSSIKEPEETEPTIEANSILKAKYYAEKTGLLSIAGDGGIFVHKLDGWPGVKSARIGSDSKDRNKKLLDKMKDFKVGERGATFKESVTVYNPETEEIYNITKGMDGVVLEKPVDSENKGFGYDPIFYLEEIGKTYSEMSVVEKNGVSHRGKALTSVKYYLQNHYGGNHIVATIGLIVKDGKMLLALRNDPSRKEFHKKWEFPGGRMELGEKLEGNLIREVKEEVGLDVEVVSSLDYIEVVCHPEFKYQVYIIPYVCRVVGGSGELADAEVLETKYVELDQILDYDLLGTNPDIIRKILPRVKELAKKYNL